MATRGKMDCRIGKIGSKQYCNDGKQTCGYDSVQFSSVAQLCLTLCDPMDCSIPGYLVDHQLPELTQTHDC